MKNKTAHAPRLSRSSPVPASAAPRLSTLNPATHHADADACPSTARNAKLCRICLDYPLITVTVEAGANNNPLAFY